MVARSVWARNSSRWTMRRIEDGGAHEQRDDVGGVDEVQRQRRGEQGHGDQPRAALAPQDAAREHDHADAGDGNERPGRLDHRDRQVLGNRDAGARAGAR